MHTLIHNLPEATTDKASLIFEMLPLALANVPFHRNSKFIRRYFAAGFPFHLAVHEISAVASPPAEYTELHVHDDYDEINVIISSDQLLYKIVLDGQEYTVGNNSSIFIPRGVMHSANVLAGSGFYIAMRMN